eukprot:3142703-Rhodomonas_salina.4
MRCPVLRQAMLLPGSATRKSAGQGARVPSYLYPPTPFLLNLRRLRCVLGATELSCYAVCGTGAGYAATDVRY